MPFRLSCWGCADFRQIAVFPAREGKASQADCWAAGVASVFNIIVITSCCACGH
ncbi:hypothetical protein KCP70_12465 [Salmonella enterica subsp. enterica]|nr:hypothetical protein KCP70_12465 [Salmonella enterica subsp. enterica]